MITETLKVILWDKEIGRLSWDNKRNISYFEYSPDFLSGNLDVFPLIASIKLRTSNRPFPGDKDNNLYHRLPPFIADSLPDSWGNRVFELWRIQQGIKNPGITPLDILAFIGKRGMGALEYMPEASGIKKSEIINLQSLTELAQRIFTERENIKIESDESLTMKSLIAVGTSAGGRQPKAIIAINSSTGEIRSGQIAGLNGFEYYVLKFGDAERNTAELEMTYYEMAKLAGINMTECKLIDVDGKKHFITKRFDRNNSGKLHMQTLAALYPEADSYEKLMTVCRKLHLPETTMEEVFRRMVFNILANNTDDHNKNFSFLMDKTGKWSLSPAYDMTYIFNSGGFLPETAHCLMMRGKLSGHTKEDVINFALENGIKKVETIIQQVADAIRKFASLAHKIGMQQKWINAIESTLFSHLEEWGLADKQTLATMNINGEIFENIHIEQAYKGNFHLYSTINGKERKFVITKNKPEYAEIQKVGINNLSQDYIRTLLQKYLL